MSKKTKKKLQQLEPTFKVGDLVGGRVRGWPLWPGYVESVSFDKNKPRYKLRFFETDETSENCVEIKHFDDFTAKEKSCLRKGFKAALSICQARHEERLESEQKKTSKQAKVKQEPDDTQNSTTIQASSEKLDANDAPVQEDMKVPNTVLEADTSSKPDVTSEQNNVLKPTAIKSPIKEENNDDDENVMLNPTREQIIAKLEEKVAKKIKEKEALKEELKAVKLSEKIIKNLRILNKHLEKFSLVSEVVSNPNNQSNLSNLDAAVRNYEFKVFPVLDKCVKHGDKKYCNAEDIYREYSRSKEIITTIITNLRAGRRREELPEEMKKRLKRCLKVTKEGDLAIDEVLSSNKSGHQKNAMIERKTNDAE